MIIHMDLAVDFESIKKENCHLWKLYGEKMEEWLNSQEGSLEKEILLKECEALSLTIKTNTALLEMPLLRAGVRYEAPIRNSWNVSNGVDVKKYGITIKRN